MWQDYIISLAIILANYALVPQVIHGFKIKKKTITFQTGLIMSFAVYLVSIMFFTLELYFSAIMNFIGGILWTILFIQSIIYRKS